MLRNMIRRGIRAVRNGENLEQRFLQNGSAIPTYCHDRVVLGIAPAPTPEEDRRLLREVARNVVADAVKSGLATA
jgi:hypothetical protein